MKRHLAVMAALIAVLVSSTSVGAASPAAAACGPGGCSPSSKRSDSVQVESYSSATQHCALYASGRGMGSFCSRIGGAGEALSLQERYGGQELQRCRYTAVPEDFDLPPNPDPEAGRYMLKTCLEGIDFNTVTGGRDRSLSMQIVFVPFGTNVSEINNGISQFLWDNAEAAGQMPVPFLEPRPSTVPLVNAPTFLTFKWVDPATKEVLATGPYRGRPNGGPFKQIQTGDVVMRAQATEIVFDPNQKGMEAVRCNPTTPYVEGAQPSGQPANACKFTFPRSSATAQENATEPIPDDVGEAFNATITVRWRVSYGTDGGPMRNFGRGFNMVMTQAVPVIESQALNQPPAVIW